MTIIIIGGFQRQEQGPSNKRTTGRAAQEPSGAEKTFQWVRMFVEQVKRSEFKSTEPV